ncbi:hypothetical protein TNCV_963541 [Trichonephila clavipes]|nr:hypothetical protein TNCV_963541 [Trichonephila clavipes]
MWFLHFRHGQRAMNMNRYTITDKADIHFLFGLANGNGRVGVWLYGERCPTRRLPNHQKFVTVHYNLAEQGSFRATIDDTPVNSETHLVKRIYLVAVTIHETCPIDIDDPESDEPVLEVFLNRKRLNQENNLVALHIKYDQSRRSFVEWAQNEMAVVPDFHKRILFSDEAHFWLNGYVNKQNCRIWSEANPQVYVETPLHPEKLTVWCALWAGGILLQKR